MKKLISLHGGGLCDLLLPPPEAEQVKSELLGCPEIILNDTQMCDFELLVNGAFSPLTGFLGSADYRSVLESSRLVNGLLWPMPIMLWSPKAASEELTIGQDVLLLDSERTILGTMAVEEIWDVDWKIEAEAVFGLLDDVHPGIHQLKGKEGSVYIGGPVKAFQLPDHFDFKELRHTPRELRDEFARKEWVQTAGFQTRNPLHRAHREMTVRAATEANAHLLLHPVVGMTKFDDIDHYTRVRCYQAVGAHYPPNLMTISLLNLAMRMAGPREALWHAIIRQNYGCSHFIVPRDHAGPGLNSGKEPFYGPYEAHDFLQKHEKDLEINIIPMQEMVYSKTSAQYLLKEELGPHDEVMNISGTELRRRLREGLEVPEWFTYPSVLEELRRAYPPKNRQGVTLFFTGLSGAGKSTIAKSLMARLLEIGGRPVTLLDGDIVRRMLSSELGFSREHRDLNILRIGFVAKEITKNKGIAICAAIAPYASIRRQVRELIAPNWCFC